MLELKFKKTGKRPKQISFRTRRFPFEFDDNLLSGIKKLAANQNDTLFIIVLAALNILLHKWTGQGDIRINASG